jgi:hypothetical protein
MFNRHSRDNCQISKEVKSVRNDQQGLRLDQPAVYQIQIQGRLRESWSRWFDDMEITIDSDAHGQSITCLTGEVTDQSALHGVLNRIRDLSLPLISVQLVNLVLRKE